MSSSAGAEALEAATGRQWPSKPKNGNGGGGHARASGSDKRAGGGGGGAVGDNRAEGQDDDANGDDGAGVVETDLWNASRAGATMTSNATGHSGGIGCAAFKRTYASVNSKLDAKFAESNFGWLMQCVVVHHRVLCVSRLSAALNPSRCSVCLSVRRVRSSCLSRLSVRSFFSSAGRPARSEQVTEQHARAWCAPPLASAPAAARRPPPAARRAPPPAARRAQVQAGLH